MDMERLCREQIFGVVLAGGLSRRMGVGDKGLLPLGRSTMLGEVVRRLRPQVPSVVINANGDPSRFAALGLPVVPDVLEGAAGPLVGVLTGMRWAAANVPGATRVLTVSSDVPFLPADLVGRLAAAIGTAGDGIAVARSGGTVHPVIGLWPIALADELDAALRRGERKAFDWVERHGMVAVDFPPLDIGGERIDPFFNANTPAELDEARRLLAREPATPITGRNGTPVVAIVGWKNSGKTTLTERLVAELTARGRRVATVKHAHHSFEVDDGETDSARHRRAGAREVAVVSSERVATIKELRGEPEPGLTEVLQMLDPCDIVIAEGYKRAPVPKIEARRTQPFSQEPLAPADPHVIAIAADHDTDGGGLPVYRIGDIAGLADFIERTVLARHRMPSRTQTDAE